VLVALRQLGIVVDVVGVEPAKTSTEFVNKVSFNKSTKP
jgi:hypothetical protein